MTIVAREQMEQFRDIIEVELGLSFGDDRAEQIAQALTSRSEVLRMSPQRYMAALDRDTEEWQHLAALLTVPESYFFRHSDHLNAFVDVAIPERMAAHPHHRVLKILSVGCAGGEEPYTLSMTILQHERLVRDWDVRIRACDLNADALRHAERGVYTPWALRATSGTVRDRFFQMVGKRYRIHDEVRQRVSFETCNVLRLSCPELRETFDIIFFRNVLIYFSAEAIRAAINGMAHLLAPGGYLFLGPAETLRGVSDDFQLCHTHEAFYYRRRDKIAALEPWGSPAVESISLAAAAGEQQPRFHPSAPFEIPMSTAWIEEIERSSERVRELHAGHGSVSPEPAPSPDRRLGSSSSAETQRLASLFSAERYGEVIAGAEAISAEAQRDPDACLLLAVAYLNQRDVPAAEAACKLLLELDSLNSSGHYVLALCREQSQDTAGAAEHDRIAVYLDETFAMPHLHLALLARRQGDARAARRSFEHASLLLGRESASRILMFGGGFSREALRDLCRRELNALRNA